tara:strand:+ start:3874 stop:4143 length:270 start_codon:yes stop_codon:yes gene_type:complete
MRLFHNKQGAEIAIKLIVVAAIALLVLIIVIVLFSSKFKVFGTSLQDCSAKSGDCEPNGCEANEVSLPDTNCEGSCCVDIFESTQDNEG